MRDLFNGIFVCQRCTYPSRNPDGCDNPACPDNPTHSPAWRETLLQRERDAAAHHAILRSPSNAARHQQQESK